jgi:hypothetical protein
MFPGFPNFIYSSPDFQVAQEGSFLFEEVASRGFDRVCACLLVD